MSYNIIMVTDFYFSETRGGAEINAESLVDRFIQHGYNISKMKSSDVTVGFLQNHTKNLFIFSNFIFLNEECKKYAVDNLKYFIYEQDHKYIKSRNPIGYPNFIAPKEEVINTEFYNGAIRVMFLTKLSMDIFEANTGLKNTLNLHSSVWRQDELAYLRQLCNNKKDKDLAILNSPNPIKRTYDCVKYCKDNNLNYELIADGNFKNFLFKMSKFKKLLFLTGHVETCARIVVEAKMLNLSVIIQKKVIGAASEKWFELSGDTLIDEMEKISYNMPLRIMEIIDD